MHLKLLLITVTFNRAVSTFAITAVGKYGGVSCSRQPANVTPNFEIYFKWSLYSELQLLAPSNVLTLLLFKLVTLFRK